MDYYSEMGKILNYLADIKDVEPQGLKGALSGLCGVLRISKITMVFYDTMKHEAQNKGSILTCYDNGSEGGEIYSKRIITDDMNVLWCRAYQAADKEPWNADEQKRAEFALKMIVTLIDRLRLKKVAERFMYYDDDGYHNIKFFIRYMNRMAMEDKFYGNAALHFNLKHFVAINHRIGRNAGTLVMRSFIKQLSDIIGDGGIVCRLGGDNFAAITDVDKLDRVIDYLKGTRITYNSESGERVPVSASVGVFVIPDEFHYNDASDIMDKILSASQAARSNGKQEVIFFDNKMIATKEKVTRIQELFPQALEKEEFLVYYQPKVSIDGGSLAGAEALCRWRHGGKLISPANFIPVLEQGMDICKLDFYMLDHVCKDIKRWLDEGKNVVRISVNLSRKHMMDIDLLERIIEIIDRNKVPHKYIEIELTETTTDIEFRDLKRVVRGLQDAGVCTSVDDFGIGYSSLNLIKEIPWNVLKVDRSFLPADEEDDNSRRSVMFKYVLAMAQELGLECVAEGVETRAQVDILKENSCDMAQGFFFDKPLPVDEFEKRMNFYQYQSI